MPRQTRCGGHLLLFVWPSLFGLPFWPPLPESPCPVLRPVALPDFALLVGRDRFDGARGKHRFRALFQNVGIAAFARVLVARLDQQPVVALLAGPAAHA